MSQWLLIGLLEAGLPVAQSRHMKAVLIPTKPSGTTFGNPVTLPPGCARFSTRPTATGSPQRKKQRNCRSTGVDRDRVWRSVSDDDRWAKRNELVHERRDLPGP